MVEGYSVHLLTGMLVVSWSQLTCAHIHIHTHTHMCTHTQQHVYTHAGHCYVAIRSDVAMIRLMVEDYYCCSCGGVDMLASRYAGPTHVLAG